jgi:YfiR/HmsC-like
MIQRICDISNARGDWPAPRHGPLWRVILMLVLLMGHMPAQAAASDSAEQQSLEYKVKAAFLLNFTKFIEWPASEASHSGSPFNICILGSDPFGLALDQIVQGETVDGRKLVVERIQREGLKSCQILYLGKSEKDVREILSVRVQGLLTVGEGESFIRDGGMIAFVIENRRVRFYVNLGAARSAALQLSSKLLSVAKSVAN